MPAWGRQQSAPGASRPTEALPPITAHESSSAAEQWAPASHELTGAAQGARTAPPELGAPERRTGRPRRAASKRLALGAILLVGLACATMFQNFSWNQTSAYDLIQALSHGQTTIDHYQANTGDKALYKGHWYSARAPGLALFSLPFYELLEAVEARAWAHESQALRNDDEIVDLIGLWGNVLPGVVLLVLVWRVAERLRPGYGAATAITLGLGTIALPLSTLLFAHILAACLGFAAFALIMRERDGPPRLWQLCVAGMLAGYAVSTEYPLVLIAAVLGVYAISRRGRFTPRGIAARAGAYVLGGAIGVLPLALYNQFAFGSFTHVAYDNIPRQQQGLFGIHLLSLRVLATLLLSSRGLLTISPVLVMAAIGVWLLYRGGRRAEALTIAAVCLCFLIYNGGYYLPFGGGFSGPRFLMPMLPFLALGLVEAYRRFPGPTIALAAASLATTIIATVTHPLVGYETETVKWARYLLEGNFQPTIATSYGLGRGWGGIWTFLLPALLAVWLAARASQQVRVRLRAAGPASLCAGVAALLAWLVFAALAPTVLGIDHQGLLDILHAGDSTALHKNFGPYPLRVLAPLAFGAGLLALAAAGLWARGGRGFGRKVGTRPAAVSAH
jgi:hypothetical protein